MMQMLVYFLWFSTAFFIKNSYEVECKYCNEDFIHVRKHEWRCKVRIDRDESIDHHSITDGNLVNRATANVISHEDAINVNDPLIENRDAASSLNTNAQADEGMCNHTYQCYCGRYFDSLRGMNVHRRSCFVTEHPYLNDLLVIREPLEGIEPVDRGDNDSNTIIPKVQIKPGLKLPKSKHEWDIANDYFKLHIDYSSDIADVDAVIKSFNEVVYKYFNDTHGNTSDSSVDADVQSKYKNMTKNKLKKCLRELKNIANKQASTLREIKYVSKMLRAKFKANNNMESFDHNTKIKENFWKYCKLIFEKDDVVVPTFDEKVAYNYFTKIFKEKNPCRTFEFPSWLKTLEAPTKSFNLASPTYKEIQKTISKMKSSASPCPVDHLSVIILKHCPILRTQVWRICSYCWEKRYFPKVWKNSITILIYKKGLSSDPSNFRPITLEPVLSKVMTSLIRNRIFTFVLENKFIESNIQKGFWTGLSGTVEHTELLTHIIKKAKNKQRQLVVTLFDLKNAFGEVHHNLIRKVLDYHHIPLPISNLVSSLYTDYFISVLTNEYQTHPIRVTRGVLQGDCLSPLLFNLCVNTLVECIKRDEVKCLGFVYHEGVSPRHWFQFADDTAIVSALNEDNQYLCNSFTKWATWANLFIRVDKCHTFGIRKSATSSIQYEPMILVNGERIPPIEINESFVYLGKDFNFGMKIDSIKEELKEKNVSYITTIDQLPLTSLNKISIVQQYVFSKYRWLFSIYDFTETWVSENIDNVIGKYLRKWFQLPVSANVQQLTFPTRQLGVNFMFAKTVYRKCKLSVRRILALSKNAEIRKLRDITADKNVRSDSIVNSVTSETPQLSHKQVCSRTDRLFAKGELQSSWSEFMGLKEQNVIIKHIVSVCQAKTITMWQNLMKRIPNNIFCFVRKALIFCLPNKTNLFRWKVSDIEDCSLCKQRETMLHIFSNCQQALNRYKWRHDSILMLITNKISRSIGENETEIYVDCESNFRCTSDLFQSLRPDIVVIKDRKVSVIELTVCFDTNSDKSRLYKQTRYTNLKDDLLIECDEFEIIYLEFTTLGFISKISYKPFNTFLKQLGVNEDRTIAKCMETAVRATYFIFCRRGKEWTNPDLLNFY